MWEQRSEVFEEDFILRILRAREINFMHFKQCKVALTVFWRANFPGYGVASAQIEASNLAGRDVDVVGAGEVRGVCRAKEAESILQYFEHAVSGDVFTVLRMPFKYGEDDVLLARAGHVFQTHIVGGLHEICDRLLLEFG